MKYTVIVVSLVALALLFVSNTINKLPDYGAVPQWSFVDQNEQPLGSAQLRGKPWAANFLFTTCPGACPLLAQATMQLQERLKAWLPESGPMPAAIVSISVDPVTDTPERLRSFAKTFNADPAIWHFARGDYTEMEALVTGGFHQALIREDRDRELEVTKDPAIANATPIDTAHSVKFALVDAEGRIRGFYDQDPRSLDRLSDALRRLSP